MQTETLYKTKFIINILLASMTFLLLVVFLFKIDFTCLFYNLFHIKCPACGLTRGFYAILNFDFVSAFKYNILSVPLFFLVIFSYILYFIDLIFHKNYLSHIYLKVTNKYYIILIILFVSFLINNLMQFY